MTDNIDEKDLPEEEEINTEGENLIATYLYYNNKRFSVGVHINKDEDDMQVKKKFEMLALTNWHTYMKAKYGDDPKDWPRHNKKN